MAPKPTSTSQTDLGRQALTELAKKGREAELNKAFRVVDTMDPEGRSTQVALEQLQKQTQTTEKSIA